MNSARRVSVLAVLALVTGTPAAVSEEVPKALQQIYVDAASRESGVVVDETVLGSRGGDVLWATSFLHSRARYIQFAFDSIKSPPGADYSVRFVLVPAERILATYPAAIFGRADQFVTGLLPPGEIRIELVAPKNPQGLSFRLERALYAARADTVTPESFTARWSFIKDLPANDPRRAAAAAVAFLHIGPLGTTCTGVLIDERTVVTNHHCLEYSLAFLKTETSAQASCDDIQVEFDYLVNNAQKGSARCQAVRSDPALDVAFLVFKADEIKLPGGEPRPPVALRPADAAPPARITMIHHPVGLPLTVDDDCKIVNADATRFRHDCSTTGGSSGAALLDEELRWVGTHHEAAYPRTYTVQMIEDEIKATGKARYNEAVFAEPIQTLPR